MERRSSCTSRTTRSTRSGRTTWPSAPTTRRRPEAVPGDAGVDAPWSAIRLGNHKLVYHHSDGRVELFDVVADVGELQDLALQQPARVRELAAELGRLLRARGARMPRRKADGQPVPFVDEAVNAR